ncbi:PqiC family protein [Robbsia sp. KACC 23696]|uniref:PqiC family protein n=1 Tax=Robbsia sp. KACC 23696 TaxID=3149231 RepID=UPI00325B2D71
MIMRRKQTDRRTRLGLSVSCLLGVLALAGCATSPDSQYYTLSTVAPGAVTTADSSSKPSDLAHPLMIEMTPVNIPDQVARSQIVTTTAGSGQVQIEDYRRWSGPLADEIGGALSTSLTRALPAIDVYRAPRPAGATVYQITVNVRRFESVIGERATVDTVWSVVRSSDHLTMTCQTIATEPVSSGYDALVAGHRKALARVAADIGAAVQQERAEPVRLPSDASDSSADAGASKTAKGQKAVNGKKPANAGSEAAVSPVSATQPAPILLCPSSNPAPSA